MTWGRGDIVLYSHRKGPCSDHVGKAFWLCIAHMVVIDKLEGRNNAKTSIRCHGKQLLHLRVCPLSKPSFDPRPAFRIRLPGCIADGFFKLPVLPLLFVPHDPCFPSHCLDRSSPNLWHHTSRAFKHPLWAFIRSRHLAITGIRHNTSVQRWRRNLSKKDTQLPQITLKLFNLAVYYTDKWSSFERDSSVWESSA